MQECGCPVAHETYLRRHLVPDYIALGKQIEAQADKSKLPDIGEILEATPEDIQVRWREDPKHPEGGAFVKEPSLLKSCERIGSALAGVKNAPVRLSLYFRFRYDVRLLQDKSTVV